MCMLNDDDIKKKLKEKYSIEEISYFHNNGDYTGTIVVGDQALTWQLDLVEVYILD